MMRHPVPDVAHCCGAICAFGKTARVATVC